MTAVTDLITELLGNRYSSGVQNVRADIDTLVAALLALSGGIGIAPGLIGVQVFAASGTYTPTPGTTALIGWGWAAGGGGGGGATGAGVAVNVGGGGGAGCFRMFAKLGSSQPFAASYTVTIGAGGTAGANTGGNGGTGGDTTMTGATGTDAIQIVGGGGGSGDNSGGVGPKLTQGALRNTGGVLTGFTSLINNEGTAGGHGVALALAASMGGAGAAAGLGSIENPGPITDASGTSGRAVGGGGAGANAIAAGRSGGAGNLGRLVLVEFTGG